MGGGTGTGASPVIAKLAREMGLLTVAIVTSPLAVEGKIRYEQAFRGIEELRQNVDSLLIINNENILEIYGRLSLKQAFGKADDILASAAKGIAEIITVESDLVNVDFADVSKVMRDSGRAHMAVAVAEGDNRAEAVAEASLRSPLLDHNLISGAKNILLNISVSDADALMYEEVVRILEYIQAHASVQDDRGVIHNANIIWGTSEKPQLGNAIELVVVATGFEGDEEQHGMHPIVPAAVSYTHLPHRDRGDVTHHVAVIDRHVRHARADIYHGRALLLLVGQQHRLGRGQRPRNDSQHFDPQPLERHFEPLDRRAQAEDEVESRGELLAERPHRVPHFLTVIDHVVLGHALHDGCLLYTSRCV